MVKNKISLADDPPSFYNYLPSIFAAITLAASAFFPDAKLQRLKLIVLVGGFILAALAWTIRQSIQKKYIFHRTFLDGWIAIYLLASFCFYWASNNPVSAFAELQRAILSVSAFFLAVQIATEKNSRNWIVGGWIFSAFFSAILGISQKFTALPWLNIVQCDRIAGTFGNPIFLAAFLNSSIPITLALCVQLKSWQRIAAIVIFITLETALFLTKTRAAFGGMILSLLTFYILIDFSNRWSWTKKIYKFRLRYIVSLTLAISLFGLFYQNKTFKNAMVSSRLSSRQQTHTLIWKDTWQMIKAHPFLGNGYGTFYVEFPKFASKELRKIYPEEKSVINDAHNEYLQILAETGTVGLFFFVGIFAVFYFKVWKKFRLPAVSQDALPVGLVAGITGILFQNFFSIDMRFVLSAIFVFFAMGLWCSGVSQKIEWTWLNREFPTVKSIAFALFFMVATGLLGFNFKQRKIYFLGLGEIQNGKIKFPTQDAVFGLWPELIRPYLAQHQIAAEPDFFEQKISENPMFAEERQAIDSPQDWRVWEILGYRYAKLIQETNAAGEKKIHRVWAEKAIAAFKKSNALNPEPLGPSNNLGNIYFLLDDRAQAIDWWKKTIQAHPETISARINLGIAYYYQGQVKEATEQLEKVLALDPSNPQAAVLLKRIVE